MALDLIDGYKSSDDKDEEEEPATERSFRIDEQIAQSLRVNDDSPPVCNTRS